MCAGAFAWRPKLASQLQAAEMGDVVQSKKLGQAAGATWECEAWQLWSWRLQACEVKRGTTHYLINRR